MKVKSIENIMLPGAFITIDHNRGFVRLMDARSNDFVNGVLVHPVLFGDEIEYDAEKNTDDIIVKGKVAL